MGIESTPWVRLPQTYEGTVLHQFATFTCPVGARRLAFAKTRQSPRLWLWHMTMFSTAVPPGYDTVLPNGGTKGLAKTVQAHYLESGFALEQSGGALKPPHSQPLHHLTPQPPPNTCDFRDVSYRATATCN